MPFPALQVGEVVPPSLAEGRAGFLLVTSYPKSGNTWVRALLTAWRLGDKPKLSALDGRPSPARQSAFTESINLAEELLRRIDARWPAKVGSMPDPNTPYK